MQMSQISYAETGARVDSITKLFLTISDQKSRLIALNSLGIINSPLRRPLLNRSAYVSFNDSHLAPSNVRYILSTELRPMSLLSEHPWCRSPDHQSARSDCRRQVLVCRRRCRGWLALACDSRRIRGRRRGYGLTSLALSKSLQPLWSLPGK
jgi:hypothetical protein